MEEEGLIAFNPESVASLDDEAQRALVGVLKAQHITLADQSECALSDLWLKGGEQGTVFVWLRHFS